MIRVCIPFVVCADNLVTMAADCQAWNAKVAVLRDNLARSYIEEAGDLAAALKNSRTNDIHCEEVYRHLRLRGTQIDRDMKADKIDTKSLAAILVDQKNYVVMGELKGGIDPAGADEHWKTARAALDRIRASFKKVYIAFVEGAIEKAMADEIYTQLQSGLLDYAANLTNDNQLSSFCDWPVNQ